MKGNGYVKNMGLAAMERGELKNRVFQDRDISLIGFTPKNLDEEGAAAAAEHEEDN